MLSTTHERITWGRRFSLELPDSTAPPVLSPPHSCWVAACSAETLMPMTTKCGRGELAMKTPRLLPICHETGA